MKKVKFSLYFLVKNNFIAILFFLENATKMLNAFASLKCLKKCYHVQKPTCCGGDKRFLFVAIPTFDIG